MLKNIKSKALIFSLFVLFLSISGSTYAQQACFTFIGDSVGCAPFKVRVHSCAVGDVSFNWNWHPSPLPTDYEVLNPGPDTSHIYTTPGTYIIDQLRGGNDHKKRIVRVFSSDSRPTFTWATCQDTLKIQFKDTVFSAYKFDPGDGTGERTIGDGHSLFKYRYTFPEPEKTYDFTIKGDIPATCNRDPIVSRVTLYKTYGPPLADSLIGIDTLSYRSRIQTRADEPFVFERQVNNSWKTFKKGITDEADNNHEDLLTFNTNDLKQTERIRVATVNGCGDTLSALDWMVLWPRTKSDNQKITLTWPKFNLPELAEFVLIRNGLVLTSLYNNPDTVYVDSSQLVCGQTYCYQFLMHQRKGAYTGKMVYISAPICAQATSNVPANPVSNITATVLDNGIEVSAIGSPIVETYTLYRKEKDGGSFAKILETNKLPILDTNADFNNRAYCYKIGFLDVCGNQSKLSDSICPVWLRIETPDEAETNLFWTRLDGWKNGVLNYNLLRFSDGNATQSTDMNLVTSLSMNQRDSVGQTICYQIQAFANNTTAYPAGSFSNKVCLTQKPKFQFPDIFTPNEDGTNDNFRCYNLFVKEFEFKIFNSWGEMVYYSTDIRKGWNGKVDGKPALSGGYAYWAHGVDEKGNSLNSKGFFTLVR